MKGTLVLLAVLAAVATTPVLGKSTGHSLINPGPEIVPDFETPAVVPGPDHVPRPGPDGEIIVVVPQPDADGESPIVVQPEPEADQERPIVVQPEPEADQERPIVVLPEPDQPIVVEPEPEIDEETPIVVHPVSEEDVDEESPIVVEPEEQFLPNGCPVDPHVHWLLPHEDDCNQFYACVWGGRVLRQCASSLHFNRELQVCDWPWDAGCAA